MGNALYQGQVHSDEGAQRRIAPPANYASYASAARPSSRLAEAEVIELDSSFDLDSTEVHAESRAQSRPGTSPQDTGDRKAVHHPASEDVNALILSPPFDLDDALIAAPPDVDEYGRIDDASDMRGVFTYDDDWDATSYAIDQPAEAKVEEVQLSDSIMRDSRRDSLLSDVIAEFNRGVRKTWTAVLVTKGEVVCESVLSLIKWTLCQS
jgi:hypothetical protein